MANLTIFEKFPGSYRLDHPDFSHVSKCTYAKGIVTAFYAANGDDPLVVKDVCDLMIDGQEFREVPIFYHQQKDYIENWKQNATQVDYWKTSGALADAQSQVITSIDRGAYSFSVKDEVAVMLQEDVPVAVLGFADGIPRRPFDFVQVELPPQLMDTLDDPPNIPDTHSPYVIQLSDVNRNGDWQNGLGIQGRKNGPDGFDLKLLENAKMFSDKVAHPTGGSLPSPLEFAYNYACFYGAEQSSRGNIMLEPSLFNPIPDYAFGPFVGYMHFGTPPDSPWPDYLVQWLTSCDTIQTIQAYGGPDQPWAGLWPGGYGRPSYWLWLVDDPNNVTNQSTTDHVMRTYLIEAGPILYLIRVFYQHTTPPSGGGRVWYWKNRIAWPWSYPAPTDWSGYSGIDPSTWTAPMWVPGYGPNPTPTKIEDCIPPPDGYLPGTINQETFYSDNPHYIYAAPSSKEILENIESIVESSNAKIDVIAARGGAPIPTPEGFVSEPKWQVYNGGIIPPFGNLRELNFKIAARIGA